MEVDAPSSAPSRESNAIERELKVSQTELLLTESAPGMIGALSGSFILVAVLWDVASHSLLVGWLAVYVALQVTRHGLVGAFRKASPTGEATLRWGSWFSLLTIMSGFAWGMAGVLFFPSQSLAHQFLLALFIAGIASASSVVYSFSSQCYLPTILAQLVPLGGRFLYEGDETQVVMGAVMLLYAVVLVVAGRRMNIIYRESLRLRFEKNNLIDSLTDQKARAEKLNEHFTAEIMNRKRAEQELAKARDELEQRVKDRTMQLADANKRLEAAKDEWEKTFDALSDLIMIVDRDHRIARLNRAMAERLGMDPSEAVGLKCRQVTHGADSPPELCPQDRLLTGESECRTEVFSEQLAGTFDVRIYPLRDSQGGYTGSVHVARDITDRIAMEEALRKSEERYRNLYELSKKEEELYRSVLNSSADAIVFYDLEGRVRYLSPSFTQMFGWTMAELEGRRVPFVAEAEKEATLASLHQLLAGGEKVQGFETERYTKDGRVLTINMSASRYNDHEGKPAGVLVILRDITERKKAGDSLKEAHQRLELRVRERTAELVQTNEKLKLEIAERLRVEQALWESEERYRTIIEDMADAYYEVDLKGRFLFLNDAADKVFDRNKSGMIGRGYRSFMSKPQADRVRALFNQVYTTGRSLRSARTKMLVGDREERDLEFSISLIKDSGGRAIGFQGICRDVTELKRAEDALRESERRYRQLVETARDIIWTISPEYRFTYMSPAVTEVLGYSVDEIMEMNPLSTLTPHSRDKLLKVLGDEINQGRNNPGARSKPCFAEVEQYHKDGSIRWMEFAVTTLTDEIGNPSGLLGISRDITDRKQAASELERALAVSGRLRAEAEAANRAKSEFLANMSHELRTPLNSVIGFSEILEDQTHGPLNQDQRVFIGLVLSSGRHLLDLINEILDLAKVESGKMALNNSRVNVHELLENSLTMVRERALRHSLHLGLEISDGLKDLEILADETKLKQIIFNLLSNSVKFTPDHGEIRVTARSEGAFLVVRVSDTGIGIHKDHLKVIFDSFQQVDSSYSRKRQGTGLGLSLTRRLVELHGGEIRAESDGEGRGSTFRFSIPIVEPGVHLGEGSLERSDTRSRENAVDSSPDSSEPPTQLSSPSDPLMRESADPVAGNAAYSLSGLTQPELLDRVEDS